MTIASIESELSGLLAKLSAKERRQLARTIARDLRKSQQQRIGSQQNPDGSAFDARKPQIHSKKGSIRRKMFARLKTATYLKVAATPNTAVVGFIGRVGRITAVHQYGLRDIVNPKTKLSVIYPQRQLLGFSDADASTIADLTLSHLASR